MKIRIRPKSLFGRSILLLVVPMVLLQLVAAFAFYQRHWDTISRRLSGGIAGEIAAVLELYTTAPTPADQQAVFDMARRQFQMAMEFNPGATLDAEDQRLRPLSITDRELKRALDDRVALPYAFDANRQDDQVEIQLQLHDGVLTVWTIEKRLFSTTTYVFILWMVGASIVLLSISIVFLRREMRPIERLAKAADNFGKGQDVPHFAPEGTREIRRAAEAFMVMRERIQRQIDQRTEMLAGVSHDLRAPLTRMKLALALMKVTDETADLKRDVDEMERMIRGYLDFARGEDSEPAESVDMSHLLGEVASDARRKGKAVSIVVDQDLVAKIRPNAFKRCLTNLVENALRYGKTVKIGARRVADAVEIAVDDDGPGIPADRRDDVFRPFRRLDAARGPDTGGVGLGLTIARDVARAHGGDITLHDAPAGGLRALVRIPV
ncbi:ATP-binding protein [Desertibaculum subflavum]|uniref:ATP-binding protein n=1 Tax=Desertibaculum subflavum TaxID=2268458 RepID=UPI000E661EFC